MDVTARKQAELEAMQQRAELGHLSRVALMGEMATSLAHELNQPLSDSGALKATLRGVGPRVRGGVATGGLVSYCSTENFP